MKEEYLALETRNKIYNLIANSPGLHKREIARELDMSLSTIDYHLHYLERRNILTSRQDGKYRRYFISEKISAEDEKIMSLLRQATPRKIVVFLLQNPRAIHKEICENVRKAPSTISFHIKKLIDAGVIEEISLGKEKAYVVRNKEKVIDLLITYKSTFLDKAVDKFVDTWSSFGKFK